MRRRSAFVSVGKLGGESRALRSGRSGHREVFFEVICVTTVVRETTRAHPPLFAPIHRPVLVLRAFLFHAFGVCSFLPLFFCVCKMMMMSVCIRRACMRAYTVRCESMPSHERAFARNARRDDDITPAALKTLPRHLSRTHWTRQLPHNLSLMPQDLHALH